MSTPTQVAQYESLSVARLDLAKASAAFEKNPKKNIAMGVFKNDGSTFKTLIKGSLSTNGIHPGEYQGKKSYSLGVNFENESDITAFDPLSETVKEFVGSEYEFTTTPIKVNFSAVLCTFRNTLYHRSLCSLDRVTSFTASSESNKVISPADPI